MAEVEDDSEESDVEWEDVEPVPGSLNGKRSYVPSDG